MYMLSRDFARATEDIVGRSFEKKVSHEKLADDIPKFTFILSPSFLSLK